MHTQVSLHVDVSDNSSMEGTTDKGQECKRRFFSLYISHDFKICTFAHATLKTLKR